MYKKKHPLGFRELKTDDEKALALQVALINSKRLYNEDFSQMPFDSPLFDFKSFYNVTDMNDILKRKNLVHLEKLRQIFDRVDPNKIIKSNNFFKKNRVPFLKILLEDSTLNKKSLLKAIAEYKVADEAKPLLIEKFKELGATKDDFSKKVIKKLE